MMEAEEKANIKIKR